MGGDGGNIKESHREARGSKQRFSLHSKIYRVPRPSELPYKTAGVRIMKAYLQDSTQSQSEENMETSVNLLSQPSPPLTISLSTDLQGNPGLPCGSDGKEPACNAEHLGSIPGSEGSPREGDGNPLPHSPLENSMDRGAWWATVHGLQRNQIQLSD